MTDEARIVLRDALCLPAQERAHVAADLLAGLDDDAGDDPDDVARLWAVELQRRARAALDGTTSPEDWPVVRERLATRLANG